MCDCFSVWRELKKKRDAHKRNYNGHYQPPVYTRDIKDSPELTHFGAFLASNKNEKKDALFESFFFWCYCCERNTLRVCETCEGAIV